MAIPIHLIFSSQTALCDETLCKVYKSAPDLFDLTKNEGACLNIMIIYLLWERQKGSHSFFAPYLDMMPSEKNFAEWDFEIQKQTQDPVSSETSSMRETV